MRLVPVDPGASAHVWPVVAGMIEKACRKGPLGGDPNDLKGACQRGENQLWVVMDRETPAACFITGIVDGVCIWLVVAGKDLSAWHHLGAHVEQWAKEQGCIAMRSFGRLGWKNKVPDYRVKGYIFEKAL